MFLQTSWYTPTRLYSAITQKTTIWIQILTWSQHCGGDVASDTTGADCYVV
jgi:hypothetical protein